MAVLALLGQIALGLAVPAQAASWVPDLLASPSGDVPICHSGAPGTSDDGVPAGHAHHGMQCALCPACHALAAAVALPVPTSPLPPRLAELAGLIAPRAVPDDFAWPSVEELPEVAELMALGWQVVDANDIGLCLLPAVWPGEHRCWLPDRLPKVFTSFDGTSTRVLPMSMRRHEPYDWEAEYAEAAGLPRPPQHRVWLLRSPWPWLGQRVVLSLLRGRARQLHGPEASPPELAGVGAEMLAWTPEQLSSWWVGPDADAATAWRALGREGDEVADLVVRGLGPTELVRLTDLDERQAIAWGEATGLRGEELVSAIAAWRARGLPADPPAGLWLLREWTDERIDAWLAAGFGVEELYGIVEPYGGCQSRSSRRPPGALPESRWPRRRRCSPPTRC